MGLLTPHKLVIEATFTVGQVTKRYRLEIPAKTPLDTIESLLVIVGMVDPKVEVSAAPLEIKTRQRAR